MSKTRIWCWVAALGVAALGAACGGSDSPTGPAEGLYRFEPTPGDFSVDVFDTFRVRVRATSGGAVAGVFYVDGDSVASGSEYAWWATTLGTTRLRVELPPRDEPVSAEWVLDVSEGQSLPPSPVTQLRAGRGEIPGSINVVWERPATNFAAIDFYRVYYDTEPIDPGQLEGVPSVEVPHDRGSVEQEWRLEGLLERTVYHIRIQIVDLIGRESGISPETENISTGHFRVSGRIIRLIEDAGGVEGFANVLIEVGENKVLTDTQGHYDLDDIPDVLREPLSARPTSGSDPYSYYWVLSDTLETVEQSLDLLLIRRSLVRLDRPEPHEVFMLQYLLPMMSKVNIGANPLVQRWQEYPIPIRTDSYVVDPGGGDIGASLLKGIDAWNLAAQEPLLVAVTGSPAYGCDFAEVNSTPGSILGEVRMLEPLIPGCLFQCIPQRVVVQMSKFNTPNVMERVAVHELGHVLWLAHSPNSEHVLSEGVDGNSPITPKRDEVLAARYVKHIPNGTNMFWYKEPEF